MLQLNDTKVGGVGLVVAAGQKIKQSDLSGQSSQTDVASGGFKPIMLNCTLQVLFKQANELRQLIQLMQAVDNDGNQKVYNIVNRTAAAFNVRQVVFSDNFNVSEDEKLHLWRVSFALKEQRSVPAVKEQRAEAEQPSSPAASSGQPVADSTQPDEAAKEPLQGFELVLKTLDDFIGPANSNNSERDV